MNLKRERRPKRERRAKKDDEKATALQASGEDAQTTPARFEILSGTRIDTGGWLLPARVHLRLEETKLILSAKGTRPYRQEFACADLRESFYSPYRGALLLAPALHARVHVLKMSPLKARAFLDILFKESVHA